MQWFAIFIFPELSIFSDRSKLLKHLFLPCHYNVKIKVVKSHGSSGYDAQARSYLRNLTC